MPADIVLIGPVRTGKSTLGGLLARQLNLSQVSLDDYRAGYYREIGYSDALAQAYRSAGGFLALYLYRNLFDAYAVERLLQDYHDCVIDFGAGIYESDESFDRVKHALAPYKNVVLVLPSPDREESLHILKERDPTAPKDISFDILRHLIYHHTYYDLATMTIYNQGETPQQTAERILTIIQS